MTRSDPAKVPAQGQTVKDAAGRQVSDFISPGTVIGALGNVTGTLKYVTGVSGFSGAEASGFYFPLILDSRYRGKTITVKRNGVQRNSAIDLEWLLYIPDTSAKFTFETVSDGVFLTLTFAGVTLADAVGKEAVIIPAQERSFGAFGQASKFIDAGLSINWSGVNGTVTGEIKKVEGEYGFSGGEENGHFYPLVLCDYYKGKSVTVDATQPKTDDEFEWIIYLDKVKAADGKVKVSYNGKQIAVLDFTKATLAET